MAVREIVKHRTSEVLRKKAKNIDKIDISILTLLDDMSETLHQARGNGLAAPQVAASLRLVVVKHEGTYVKLINPVPVKTAGEQISIEGCLSLPGIFGKVKRPELLIIEALNENGKAFQLRASDRFAATLDHELDHLDGILFIDKAIQLITVMK